MFFVYIVSNKKNGTLYTGHTDDLGHRMEQHRQGVFEGFSKKYGCTKLVWFEWHETRDSAFTRERQIKKWYRNWKIRLIEDQNLNWHDLTENWTRDSVMDLSRKYQPSAHSHESGNPD